MAVVIHGNQLWCFNLTNNEKKKVTCLARSNFDIKFLAPVNIIVNIMWKVYYCQCRMHELKSSTNKENMFNCNHLLH